MLKLFIHNNKVLINKTLDNVFKKYTRLNNFTSNDCKVK